jgi:hypothetical protein
VDEKALPKKPVAGGDELWLIQIPGDMDVEDLTGLRFKLTGEGAGAELASLKAAGARSWGRRFQRGGKKKDEDLAFFLAKLLQQPAFLSPTVPCKDPAVHRCSPTPRPNHTRTHARTHADTIHTHTHTHTHALAGMTQHTTHSHTHTHTRTHAHTRTL